MNHHIFIRFETPAPCAPQIARLIRTAIRGALKAESVSVPCEVDVLITGDAEIHKLNLAQRGVDRPTDVLSFPAFSLLPGAFVARPEDIEPATGLMPLGDMVLSLERAARQAREYGHSFHREIGFLTVHSMLHLLGYDHMDDGPEQRRMRAREEVILQELGLQRPL
ncbi:MAG: rRNA maturation RNase YbeY [Oscillospiraceae bacterium]|nr:rRNA maturation RNase YbeY [Oscillospiraceae bacterium]